MNAILFLGFHVRNAPVTIRGFTLKLFLSQAKSLPQNVRGLSYYSSYIDISLLNLLLCAATFQNDQKESPSFLYEFWKQL